MVDPHTQLSSPPCGLRSAFSFCGRGSAEFRQKSGRIISATAASGAKDASPISTSDSVRLASHVSRPRSETSTHSTADDRSAPVMSGRLLSSRWAPLMRRRISRQPRLRQWASSRAGGLLHPRDGGPSVTRSRRWPFGASSIHNLPAVRSISFARALPQLALKMARLPALLGASMMAGLAYVQYQAARKLAWPSHRMKILLTP
jgi:hypothetical protein